jgi:hypothetical protein
MKNLTLLSLATFMLTSSLYGATLGKKIKNNSLIVYNSNIALVHEERTLEVTQNDTQIIYENVAQSIDQDSINVSLPQDITLYSQQYRFDKLTLQKLLDAYIGKKVEVRLLKNRNEFKIITATLLSSNGATSLVRTLDFKILSVDSSAIRFEEIPEELVIKPSLIWNIQAKGYLKEDMKLDYLLKGISFKSNYILTLHKNSAKLVGWITLNNRSGKSFKNTKLSLLAGDIQRDISKNNRAHMLKAVAMSNAPHKVSHKAVGGYHLYTLPFDVTVANNETTQIKFLQETNTTIQRVYKSHLSNPLYLQGKQDVSVSQYVKLSPMSVALPKGVIRSYTQVENQTILLAENTIEDTPKETPFTLKLGKDFDTKVTQTLLSRQDTQSNYNVDILYSIKNSSDENRTIFIEVPFNKKSSSQITSKEPYTFTEGNRVTFKLDLTPMSSKEFKVNYESSK